MIRINLLPVPKARKQETLILQVAAGLLILGGIAMGCYFIGAGKKAEIASINAQIQQKQREIAELKPSASASACRWPICASVTG
jgi:hypothetical protein